MPSFLEAEINLDLGHVVLLLVLIGFVFYLVWKARKEGMQVDGKPWPVPVVARSCKCPDCAASALDKAQSGVLYGCNENDPYIPSSPEICNYSYRKELLHGCGIAS